MSWEEKMLKEMGTALAKIYIRSSVSSDLDQITHALCEASETSSDTDLRETVKALADRLRWATSKVDEIRSLSEKFTSMSTDEVAE